MDSATTARSAGGEPARARAACLVRSPGQEIVDFVVTECALADQHRYQDWESLWAVDEGLYWVCGPGNCDDPAAGFTEASFIYDNRVRVASRVRQLATNKRLSQVPVSELSRVVSNYRLADEPNPTVIGCWVNFLVSEFRAGRSRTWAGRALYRMRDGEAGLCLIEKRVILVDRAAPLDTFTFIL